MSCLSSTATSRPRCGGSIAASSTGCRMPRSRRATSPRAASRNWSPGCRTGRKSPCRARMKDGVQQALAALEAEGCDAILLLCTGTFDGLGCKKAWLIEPDHIIPGMVAGLVEQHQLGVLVPIASQIGSESGKWRVLHRPPIFAAVSPYVGNDDALLDAGKQLKAQGADAILLDCIGFTERHRHALLPLGRPVILSNAVAAKALSELLGG